MKNNEATQNFYEMIYPTKSDEPKSFFADFVGFAKEVTHMKK